MDKETLEEAVKEVADMFLEDVIRKGKLRKHMGLLPTFREHWAVLQPRLLTLYSSAREKEVLLLLKFNSLPCSRADVVQCAGARSDTVESWMSSGSCTCSAHNLNSITCQAEASQIFPPCKPEGFLD